MNFQRTHTTSLSDRVTHPEKDSRQDTFAQNFRREVHTLAPHLQPGDVWADKYRILRHVGQGGMGDVYEAAHVRTSELRYAVKILRMSPSEDVAHRALQEASSIAKVRHSHVVRVTDVDITSDGIPFLVMEFVGIDLQEYARLRGGVLTAPEAVEFCVQICDALDAAHAQGIVHRDIKPRNCLVYQGRDTNYVVVSDFGLARSLNGDDSTTSEWTIAGSRGYMAPEILLVGRPRPDHRVDLYSVGATLFCLLAGSPPSAELFDNDTLSRDYLRKKIPRALVPVFLRTLARKAEKRYSSARELRDELRRLLPALNSMSVSHARRTWLSVVQIWVAILAGSILLIYVISTPDERPSLPLEPVDVSLNLQSPVESPPRLPDPRAGEADDASRALTTAGVAVSFPEREPHVMGSQTAEKTVASASMTTAEREGRGDIRRRPAVRLKKETAPVSEPICEALRVRCWADVPGIGRQVITIANHGQGPRVVDWGPFAKDNTAQDCATRHLVGICQNGGSLFRQCKPGGPWTCPV